MKRSNKILIILGLFSVLSIFLCFISKRFKVNSIGIIGSADGPTSIIVTETTDNILLYVVMGILILAFIIVSFILLKKK